jgi:hypothetical protein
MTPKELEKVVVDKIYEGKTHQEVYDELNAQFPNREIDLARMVSTHVSLPQRTQHNTLNLLLMGLLVANIGSGVFLAFFKAMEVGAWALIFTLIPPAIYVVLVIGVVKWDLRAYRAAGFLGILGMISITNATMGAVAQGTVNIQLFNPYSLLPLGMIGLGFFLYSKLGGKYKTASQQFTDAKGQIRARLAIRFTN